MLPNQLTRNERKELDALSKEIFGSSNRWKKLIEKGYSELVTRTVQEVVPGEEGKEATTREVKVPVLTESGGRQSRVKYHTVESIQAFMLDMKAKLDAFKAEMKKKEDEQKHEKRKDEIHKVLSGNAT